MVVVDTSGSGGDFFVFFFLHFRHENARYRYYYRAGLILTKTPSRERPEFRLVVPIVLLSSLRFFCTCGHAQWGQCTCTSSCIAGALAPCPPAPYCPGESAHRGLALAFVRVARVYEHRPSRSP